MTRIVLVRHAQSVWPRFGEPDYDERPLSEDGLAEAESLVARLTALAPAAVLSSPQLRAVQTVRPTASALGLEVATWHELREWDSGLVPSADWETPCSYSWANPAASHGDGESLDELTVRAGEALARVAALYLDATVVVGSHGTFLSRALISAGRQVDWEVHRTMPMPAVYEIRR
ncbi:histidine phosphatase family protein [Lentzea sp. NPDC051213]|uniref:histidine phosphatase family protein n=1 Tax=Lentzea sp. NPDC051213 TaxID=3364126 RepID=UPI0037A20A61